MKGAGLEILRSSAETHTPPGVEGAESVVELDAVGLQDATIEHSAHIALGDEKVAPYIKALTICLQLDAQWRPFLRGSHPIARRWLSRGICCDLGKDLFQAWLSLV